MAKKLREAGLRVQLEARNEKIGYKLREARNARDSYICVIGEREACLLYTSSLEDSIRNAKEYLTGALGAMLDLGKGSGPLNHMYRL